MHHQGHHHGFGRERGFEFAGRGGMGRGPGGPGGHGFGHGFGHGSGHGGFHGRDGEGRRRRLFDGGEFKLVLLALIAEAPRHGYDLIREIEARAHGAYAPSPGVVYPTTTLLTDMGLISESESDGRKIFTITEAGRAYLAEHRAEADIALARLVALGEMRERTDAAPVRRAMGNLKTALNNRLSEDGVKKETILEVARLIDEAAGKIERL